MQVDFPKGYAEAEAKEAVALFLERNAKELPKGAKAIAAHLRKEIEQAGFSFAWPPVFTESKARALAFGAYQQGCSDTFKAATGLGADGRPSEAFSKACHQFTSDSRFRTEQTRLKEFLESTEASASAFSGMDTLARSI